MNANEILVSYGKLKSLIDVYDWVDNEMYDFLKERYCEVGINPTVQQLLKDEIVKEMHNVVHPDILEME